MDSRDIYSTVVPSTLSIKGLNLKKKKKKEKKVDERKVETKIEVIVPDKTPAQIAFEEKQAQMKRKKLEKEKLKSHKERVAEYNKYLSTLSEHHDIPKIGPG